MKIKDQIRARREQLGVSVDELAKRVGVSHQAVRHWESGRSFPGKGKAPAVEDALSFRLDWTEGVQSRLERPDITALLDQQDIEILLSIRKLPESVKKTIIDFTMAYLDALDGRTAFMEKLKEKPLATFTVQEVETRRVISSHNSDIRKSPARKHTPAGKRSAQQ